MNRSLNDLFGSSEQVPAPVDSFCQQYQQIIKEKGDGSISANSGVKKRILANEQIYQCECLKLPLAICKGT